jgi:hypothetical protein
MRYSPTGQRSVLIGQWMGLSRPSFWCSDGLASGTDALVKAITAKGGTKVTAIHVATDHGWSDHRIYLESTIITWLAGLK